MSEESVEDPQQTDVFALLADEYARAILTATAEDHRSAPMLAETLNAAHSTVYDRIDRLLKAGLLDERAEIDGGGNHYATYRARLDGLHVRLTGEGFDLEVETTDRDAAADRLTDMWREL